LNIFDDGMRKSVDEIARRGFESQAPNDIAREIAEDLLAHLGKYPTLFEDISVAYGLDNVVKLIGVLSRRDLHIIRQGMDAFQLDDRCTAPQTEVTEPFRTTGTGGRTIDQREMVHEVLAWLNERGRGRAA
jgi:hypothetical protein